VLGGLARIKPLFLDAVKMDIGHLETGAGIAGLLKLVTSLHGRSLPANLHLRDLNDRLQDVETFAVRFPTESVSLPLAGAVVGRVIVRLWGDQWPS